MVDSKKAKFDKLIARAKAEMKEPIALKLVDLLEFIGNEVHKEEEAKKDHNKQVALDDFSELPEKYLEKVTDTVCIFKLMKLAKLEEFTLNIGDINDSLNGTEKVIVDVTDDKAVFSIVEKSKEECENCGEVHE